MCLVLQPFLVPPIIDTFAILHLLLIFNWHVWVKLLVEVWFLFQWRSWRQDLFVFEIVIGLLDHFLFAENCRSVILFFNADSVVGMNLLPLGLDWGINLLKTFLSLPSECFCVRVGHVNLVVLWSKFLWNCI